MSLPRASTSTLDQRYGRWKERAFAGFRWPDRKTILAVAFGWVFVLFLASVALPRKWWTVGLLVEASIYLMLTLLLVTYVPFRRLFFKMSLCYRAVIGLAFAAFILGQIVGGSRLSFPLVRFAMFTDPVSHRFVHATFEGTLETGERIAINPTHVLPSLSYGRFQGKFWLTCHRYLTNMSGSVEELKRCREFIDAIGQIYNLENPEKPIDSIDVIEYQVDLRRYTDRSHFYRKPLVSVSLLTQ